jgi:hypothetical protein
MDAALGCDVPAWTIGVEVFAAGIVDCVVLPDERPSADRIASNGELFDWLAALFAVAVELASACEATFCAAAAFAAITENRSDIVPQA